MAQSLIIVNPLAFAALVSSSGEASTANLATPNPKESFVASAPGNRTFTFDLGSAVSVDTFFFGFTNLVPGAAVRFSTSNQANRSDKVEFAYVNVLADFRHPHVVAHGNPVVRRYIDVDVITAQPTPLVAGVLAVGRAFKPYWGHEYGGGRRVIDTGTKERLKSGAFGVDPGVRAGAWSWSMGDLTDVEVEALYDLGLEIGETGDVLVVEDPTQSTGISNRCHWGKFAGIDYFERLIPGASRWAWRIEDWV